MSRPRETAGAGDQAAFVAALLDPTAPPPPGLAMVDGAPAHKRFNVYRNNVVHGLATALGQGFPALRRLLGPSRFQSVAVAFARARLPRTPLMVEYGDALPAFLLDDFAPTRGLPALAALARLELARRASYNAADAEPLDAAGFAARLAGRPAEAVVSARLRLHPSLRLVRSDWPILRLWSDLQADDADAEAMLAACASSVAPRGVGETVLTLRPALTLSMRTVSAGVAAFLSALEQGAAIGAAAAAASAADPNFDLAEALGGAIAAGAMVDALMDGEDQDHIA